MADENELPKTDNSFPWVSDELLPVAMRLARVDELAFEIAQASIAWAQLSPLSIDDPLREGKYHAVVESIRPVPPMIAMRFSEAINHLRAAIDNALLVKVESVRTDSLTENQAKNIALPIHTEPEKLARWTKKITKEGPIELVEGALAQSILQLQPLNDAVAGAPIFSPIVALGLGTDQKNENPLHLLQTYSNADKHRQLQLAAVGHFVQPGTGPLLLHTDKALEVGQTLYETSGRNPELIEISPYIAVKRGTTGRWAAVGKELHGLQSYVSKVAIPMIMTGLQHSEGLPPQIDLGDNGQGLRERLNQGTQTFAFERGKALALDALNQADQEQILNFTNK